MKHLDKNEFENLFYYDKTSPSGLKWNTTIYSGGVNERCMAYPGKIAGSISRRKDGSVRCWTVSKTDIEGKRSSYQVHRVIACLQGLAVNAGIVDHIDGNTLNNNIKNIRIVTHVLNSRNCKVRNNSPYGVQGICFHTNKVGNQYFKSKVRSLIGDEMNKYFSIDKLGLMVAFRDAVKFRHSAIINLNENGAGYTDRHSGLSQFKIIKE